MPEPDPIRTEAHVPEPSQSLDRTVSRSNTVEGTAPPAGAGAAPAGVPGYTILGELGRGGMGVVYHARHQKLNREVALKLVLGDAKGDSRGLIRFLAEAEAIAAVKHANVVQVYDYGEADGRPFLALEYLPGGTLATHIKNLGRAKPAAVAELVAKIASGVAAAHALGMVHRDLKPENVLLTADGEPKVSDFGLAKRAVGENLTQTGAIVGTPAYMSPEQADGTKFVGPPADVWALGVMLYQCLTGDRPFRAKGASELFAQISNADPEFPRDKGTAMPRDLELICRKCLEKNAADRYPGAAELAADLTHFARGEPISIRPAGFAERALKWAKRKPALAGLYAATVAGAVLLAVAVTIGVLYGRAVEARTTADGERANAVAAREAEEQQRQKAEQARGEAQAGEKREAGLKYTRDVDLAHREYLANNLGRARELLAGCPVEMRRWEWYYVHRLCYGDVLTLKGHAGRVTAARFHPNGKHILTAGKDNVARVWDAETGDLVFTLAGHTAPVYSATYDWNGARILTAGDDFVPRLWDGATGKLICEMKGHTGAVINAEFNLFSTAAVTYSADKTIRTWNLQTGAQMASQTNTVGDNRGASVFIDSPDRKLYASLQHIGEDSPGSQLSELKDRDTLKPVVKLEGDPVRAEAAAFSRDSKQFLAGTSDREARVWDVNTGKLLGTYRGHTGPVTAVGFAPDGARFVTGGADGPVRVWAIRPAAAAKITRAPELNRGGVRAFALDRTGRRLDVTDHNNRVTHWDTATGDAVPAPPAGPRDTLCRLDTPAGPRFVAVVGPVAKGKGPQPLPQPQRRLVLTDAAGKEVVGPLAGDTTDPTGAWPDPDHTRFASAHRDGTVRVWDSATGAPLFTVPGTAPAPGASPVQRVVFDRTGSRLAISDKQAVRVWDVKAAAVVRRIDSGKDEYVSAEAFTPDGRLLLVYRVARSAAVYDVDRGAADVTIRGHAVFLRSAALSPDGDRVVTADDDAVVKVWDRHTGQELLTLPGVKWFPDRVAFSPDGLWLLATSASANQPLVIWDATPVNPAFPRPRLSVGQAAGPVSR